MPAYHISAELKQPAYLQLYRQIRDDITGGVCPYGMKLPSKRFLAAETGLSVITVQHAYDLLADEGYIRSRERSGYFVIYRESDLFAAAPPVPSASGVTGTAGTASGAAGTAAAASGAAGKSARTTGIPKNPTLPMTEAMDSMRIPNSFFFFPSRSRSRSISAVSPNREKTRNRPILASRSGE